MSALIGRVIEVYDTQHAEDEELGVREEGPIHAVILDGWIVDSLEPRYLAGVLESGQMANGTKKTIDGVDVFRPGTLLCLTHRQFGMAPAPQEAKEAVARVGNGGRRGTFRPGEGWSGA